MAANWHAGEDHGSSKVYLDPLENHGDKKLVEKHEETERESEREKGYH